MSALDPIELQVVTGALRAACEEMGAVLIGSARSPNIKERHDASTALFDAARRDGDAGRAHPGAPRLDARGGGGGARRGPLPGLLWILNDPFAGRHASARHHRHHARCCSTESCWVRGQPRAPRRRGRAHPGIDARGQPHAGGGGRGDRAHSAGRAEIERAVRTDAPARRARADLRAQLAANRIGRAAPVRARAADRSATAERCLRRGARLRRAAHPRVRGGAPRRRAPRRGCARGRRGRSGAAPARDGRGRAADPRLQRQRRHSTRATSTARWRSPARPAFSRCGC